MNPAELLEHLESTGKVNSKIIGKLRRQLANPDKKVTVKKILNFLVKNELITKEEAVELRGQKKRNETDDLLVGVMGSGEVAAEVAELDEPAADSGNLSPVDLGSDPLVEAADYNDTLMVDPIAPAAAPVQPVAAAPIAAPIADPINDWDDGLSAGNGTAKPSVGFQGKIDSRDQWATKWVYIGFGTLGLLLVAGTFLFLFLSLISAEDRFEAASQSFENGTYGDAIKKFEEFLEKHGSHEKAPLAKVKLAHALIADTYKRKNWNETIVRAKTQLPPLVEDEDVDLDVIRQDLAVMLPTSVLNLAKKATQQESKSELTAQLAVAKEAKTLVDNPVYIPGSKRKQANVAKLLDEIDEEIAKGEGLIRKQGDFDKAMTEIKTARESSQTDQAFTIYNQLIRDYGDLRANQDLQAEMRQVSQMEAQLVQPNGQQPNVTDASRPSPVQSSIVLASKTGTPIDSLIGEVIPVLADGSIYGIDIGSGAVLWRHFVGYQTNIQPVSATPQSILIGDQFNNDLLLVGAKDGKVIWRAEIGEPFLTPQLDETNVLLTCDSGNLFKIDLESGQTAAGVKIPQSANVGMSKTSRNGEIYQPGFYSNLYILSSEDLSCKDVYYLGHYKGSISVPPVVWNNYILVAVNQSGVCDLHVLRPNAETGTLELAQRISRVTRGIVTNPLARFGRFMLINSESGDLKILELNTANETNPVRILEEERFENRDGRRTHVATAGNQLWIGSRGIMRYKVSRSLGTFDRQVISNPDDYFVGPIRKIGDSIVHIRKRLGSALTSVSAVDAETLKQIWRTDLGGPVAGPPMVFDDRIAAVSSQGDLFSVAAAATDNQIASDEIKSSNILENLLFDETLMLPDSTAVCLGPPGRKEMLFVDATSGSSKLINLPAPADDAACRSIVIDGDLIVPSKQGQVLRINPKNGRIVGTPFLPAVNPGNEIAWRQPANLGNGKFVIGAAGDLYLIDASGKRSMNQVAELNVEGLLKSRMVASGNSAIGVFGFGDKESLISFNADGNNLAAGASIPLPGLTAEGPWGVGEAIMLRLDNNQLVSFDSQLQQQWAADVGNGSLAAPPAFTDSGIQLYFRNGKTATLNADSGAIESEFNLGQPIAHPPVISNGQAVFSGRDGTLHRVSTSQ